MDNKNLNEIPEEKLEDAAGGLVPLPHFIKANNKEISKTFIGHIGKEVDEMIIKAADSEKE